MTLNEQACALISTGLANSSGVQEAAWTSTGTGLEATAGAYSVRSRKGCLSSLFASDADAYFLTIPRDGVPPVGLPLESDSPARLPRPPALTKAELRRSGESTLAQPINYGPGGSSATLS